MAVFWQNFIAFGPWVFLLYRVMYIDFDFPKSSISKPGQILAGQMLPEHTSQIP